MNMPIYFIYIYFFSNKTKQNEFDFTTICYVCRLTVNLSPGPMVLRILEERGGSPPTGPCAPSIASSVLQHPYDTVWLKG